MAHFEGDRDFTLPLAQVWLKLSDCRFLAECVPGMVSVRDASAESAVCVLKPGFSFVRGTLEVTLRRTEATPETALKYQVDGKGIGSSSRVVAALGLSPQGTGTHLHWSADITELGGLLRAIPQGLIKASAERVILDAWTAIDGRMTSAS
jgi:carbon monoxide dehydrogenase subunit G